MQKREAPYFYVGDTMGIKDYFLLAIGLLGALLVVGNFFLGLFTGKVFYPKSLINNDRSSYLITRSEAPFRYWHIMIVYGILTALIIFICVLYYRHPEIFIL